MENNAQEKLNELKVIATDCLAALETWSDKEFKDGIVGHKVTEMRPILLAKSICKKILKN